MDVNLLAGKIALANVAQLQRVAHIGLGGGGVFGGVFGVGVTDIANVVDAVSRVAGTGENSRSRLVGRFSRR